MRLVFTKDVGRFRAGEIRDYPRPTWEGIERSARLRLDQFTRSVDEAAKAAILTGGKQGSKR